MTTAATLSRRPGSHASAELSPHPAAARQARALTRTTLTQWGIPHLADDAETISAELTANAQHAATAPHGTRPAIIIAIHPAPATSPSPSGTTARTSWELPEICRQMR